MSDTYLLIAGGSAKPRRLPVIFSEFPDQDIHCVVKDIKHCKGKSVLIFHRLYPRQNDQLIKLLFLIELLNESGATDVQVYAPYLPYCRQDKRHITGEAISMETVCHLLSAAGCQTLYTLDCHFMKGINQMVRNGLGIINISVGEMLVEQFREKLGHNNFDVVGPDKGSRYLTVKYGNKNMQKTRGNYGELGTAISYRDIAELIDEHINHEHDHVLIIDDMISTGSTIHKAAEKLRAKGVKHISCAATHGFFLKDSFQALSANLEELLYSDSIIQPDAAVSAEAVFKEQVVPLWLTRPPALKQSKTKEAIRERHQPAGVN